MLDVEEVAFAEEGGSWAQKLAQLREDVARDAMRYMAITPEVVDFPYGTDANITYDMWQSAMTAAECLGGQGDAIESLDAVTRGGFTRLVSILGADSPGERPRRDFRRVVNALGRGVKSEYGETVELDRFGCPNIAMYMAGCRQSVSVPLEEIAEIDLRTFVAPWHAATPSDMPEGGTRSRRLTYADEAGTERVVGPYRLLSPWDMYRIVSNLCAAGFERAVRSTLGGKVGARLASELEEKAAVIRYENINGVTVGYSLACNELDKMFMAEIVKDSPEYQLTYKPDRDMWGPTIALTLPRDEHRAWRAAGGNPQQLKHLRGAVYTLLLNEDSPQWWKRYQVTITIGQVERALWGDDNHHMTEGERRLLLASFDLLAKTRIECTYPPTDRKARHTHIDETKLAIHGLTLFPAIWVEETDARGNVVNAAFKFHAMPPLDEQADELNQAYTLPYLKGTPRLGAMTGRVEATTYDVQTALAKYVRIAKAEGSQTVYIDSLAKEVDPFRYSEITELAEWAEAAITRGDEGSRKSKRLLLARMRKLRARVKRDVLRVLPQLIENEATASRPCYLNVDGIPGRRDGFVITRARQPERQRKDRSAPETHFSYGKRG